MVHPKHAGNFYRRRQKNKIQQHENGDFLKMEEGKRQQSEEEQNQDFRSEKIICQPRFIKENQNCRQYCKQAADSIFPQTISNSGNKTREDPADDCHEKTKKNS